MHSDSDADDRVEDGAQLDRIEAKDVDAWVECEVLRALLPALVDAAAGLPQGSPWAAALDEIAGHVRSALVKHGALIREVD